MANGRCRLDGGLSTGPKTAEGIACIRRAVTKHGRYSAAAKLERQQFRELLRGSRSLFRHIRDGMNCPQPISPLEQAASGAGRRGRVKTTAGPAYSPRLPQFRVQHLAPNR